MSARHPNKEVRSAVEYATSKGWALERRKGHCWARLKCPKHDRTGCMISVYCTPRNNYDHASQIKKMVDKCDCFGCLEDDSNV